MGSAYLVLLRPICRCESDLSGLIAQESRVLCSLSRSVSELQSIRGEKCGIIEWPSRGRGHGRSTLSTPEIVRTAADPAYDRNLTFGVNNSSGFYTIAELLRVDRASASCGGWVPMCAGCCPHTLTILNLPRTLRW